MDNSESLSPRVSAASNDDPMDTDENDSSARPLIKADPLAEGVDLSTRNGGNGNRACSDHQAPDNQSNNGDSPSNEKSPNDHIEPKLLLNLIIFNTQQYICINTNYCDKTFSINS